MEYQPAGLKFYEPIRSVGWLQTSSDFEDKSDSKTACETKVQSHNAAKHIIKFAVPGALSLNIS